MIRLLEYKLGNKYSANKIVKSLTKLECVPIKSDIYTVLYRDELIKDLEEKYNFDFSKKYLTLSNIRKFTTNKKRGNPYHV